MLNTGIFPNKLKVNKIMPIHKKYDESLFTNYRPISLLPATSKLFEKVLLNNFISFFKKSNHFIMDNMVFNVNIQLN